MIAMLGRRSLELLVFCFAVYAFAFTPLGERSAWQHLLAVVQSPEARHAKEEAEQAARRLKRELLDDEDTVPSQGSPTLPDFGPPGGRSLN